MYVLKRKVVVLFLYPFSFVFFLFYFYLMCMGKKETKQINTYLFLKYLFQRFLRIPRMHSRASRMVNGLLQVLMMFADHVRVHMHSHAAKTQASTQLKHEHKHARKIRKIKHATSKHAMQVLNIFAVILFCI